MSIISPNTTGLDSALNEMKLLPWKFLQLDDGQYLSKFVTKANSYCFLLTDLNSVYLEYLISPAIGPRFEELNPGMEMPLHRILSLLENLIPYSEEASASLNITKNTNSEINLQSKTEVAGIPLMWQFKLTKCERDLLKEQLLNPLIGMITELQQRQKYLISLIKRKDAEIEDYKEGGAKVSKKSLETSRFNETQFLSERNCPELLFETARTSVKTTFDCTNDDFYTAVATAHLRIQEQEQRMPEDEQVKGSTEESRDVNHTAYKPEETEKDRETARRKELEQKLSVKPAKKKKKIAL